MRTAQTKTARTLLMVASRINTPAKTLSAMMENGLTMRQAVEYDKGCGERYDKDGKPPNAAVNKNWFSHQSLLEDA